MRSLCWSTSFRNCRMHRQGSERPLIGINGSPHYNVTFRRKKSEEGDKKVPSSGFRVPSMLILQQHSEPGTPNPELIS